MFQKNFKPALRFMVVSDVHYKDEPCVEEERMAKALQIAYRLSEESESYKKLDAVYAVGDFANSGTETQMRKFKATLDKYCKEETQYCLMMASHEYHGGGVEKAHELFKEIFDMPVDNHRVINGFHFISMTCSHACEFEDDKVEFAKKALKEAREADPKKPIFFFQHPHITDTVSGSIYWADEKFYTTFMDFPQVIDFSGHSHYPVNDPRSVWQNEYTAIGTGSLKYTELTVDGVKKVHPALYEECANFLIVEADKDNNLRVSGVDILAEEILCEYYFSNPAKKSNRDYTPDKQRSRSFAPVFPKDAEILITEESGLYTAVYPKADGQDDTPIVIYRTFIENEKGETLAERKVIPTYYLYETADKINVCLGTLLKGRYKIRATAENAFGMQSEYIEKTIEI